MPFLTSDSWTAAWTSRVMSTKCVRREVFTVSVFMGAPLRNGNNEMRANIFQAGMAFDLLEALLSPARCEWQKTKFARLQLLFRVQQIRQEFFVSSKNIFFAIERAANFLLQLVRLIRDFLLRSGDRIPQSW